MMMRRARKVECVHPVAIVEEQSRWIDVIAAIDEVSLACAKEEMAKICSSSSGVVEEVLAKSVDEKMLRACEGMPGESLVEVAEARVRVVDSFRESTSRLEESLSEVSRLRAECADLTVRVEEEQAKYRELRKTLRTARQVADVARSACASRTEDSEALRDALDDSDLRLEEQTRRAVIAEHSRLYDEEMLCQNILRLEERTRYDEAQTRELVSSRVDVEIRLADERKKRQETERALAQVYRDVVIERARADDEKARADEAVEKSELRVLESLRQENLLLRGKITALETALIQEEREKIDTVAFSSAEQKNSVFFKGGQREHM